MSRRKKRRFEFRFYVIMLAALGLVGYGLVQLVDGLIQRTAVIESGGASNEYVADVVIVRSEKMEDVEGLSRIKYYADEGQLIYKGNKIADVYASAYSKTDENKLLNVRERIKNYHTQKLATDTRDPTTAKLDAQAQDYAHEIELVIAGKTTGNLLNLQRQIQDVLSERQNHLKSRYSGDQNLNTLYGEESALVKKIEGWTTTYLAKSDCLISFYTDGYEEILTPASVETITAQQVRAVLQGETPAQTPSQRGRTPVFRTVQPKGWYMLLLSNDPNWKPVNGQSYKVKLAGFEDMTIDGVVIDSSRSGNEILVRMSVDGDVRTVLNTRISQATIGEQYVQGLKVPRNAIYQQGGELGVVLADTQMFAPITVIEQTNSYAIIQSQIPGALVPGQKIKVF